MMDSSKLLYFKAIAEAGSLTKAAKNLYISQPALSKQLAALETELNCTLFNRINGRLYINANGKQLLKYAERQELLFEEIQTFFSQQHTAEHVISIYSIGNYFSLITRDYFNNESRPIRLQVGVDLEMPQHLISGDADLIIADDMYLKESASWGVRCIPIISEQLLLLVPHQHPLASRKTIDIHELEHEQIMRQNTNNWLNRIKERNNLKLDTSWAVDLETWRYCLKNKSEDAPLCFDTSASYMTPENSRSTRTTRKILRVTGEYTNRMLYLWYFEKNEPYLQPLLKAVSSSLKWV